MSDFEKRLEQLKRDYRDRPLSDRTYALREFHLEWAQAVQSSQPELAIQQYLLAEDQQSTIGTFATGSGEGLASMSELYGIMGKRADVLERLAGATADRSVSVRHLNEALAVWTKINEDPNGLGEDTPAASKIKHLRTKLGKPKI
jgi:hypothetical protein